MLHPESNHPAERQLLNIVSEMSLASQVPEPEVWLLDRENSTNAFAAGKSIEGAVIGATAGALQELDPLRCSAPPFEYPGAELQQCNDQCTLCGA